MALEIYEISVGIILIIISFSVVFSLHETWKNHNNNRGD